MNFRRTVPVSLSLLKAFVYEAKQHGFAIADEKTTLTDQTSVYSYRPFKHPRFGGMIYTDMYNGNTIEHGQESVSIDLIIRWRNQYYGGTKRELWNLEERIARDFGEDFVGIGDEFPEVVSAFLKMALRAMPLEFPVRGPREFKAYKVEYEGKSFHGEWLYVNLWKPLPLWEEEDPFVAYKGEEYIFLNGVKAYWHVYHGGLVRDKYFPFTLFP